MEKVYSVSQLKSTLFPLFRDYGVRKAVLFGSYGKGTATEKMIFRKHWGKMLTFSMYPTSSRTP